MSIIPGGYMRNIMLAGFVPLFLVACHQPPPRECTLGPEVGVQVRSPIDDSANRSISMGNGQSVRGSFLPTAALRVDAVGVQIGNDGGRADGEISIELCQDGRCVHGHAQVQGSKDNDYLEVPLKPALPVSFDAGVVTYSLKRESGSRSVAVWAYPGIGSQTSLTHGDDKRGEALNLMMRQY